MMKIIIWGLPALTRRASHFLVLRVPLRYGFARRTMVRPVHTRAALPASLRLQAVPRGYYLR